MLGFSAIGETPLGALPDFYTIPPSETEEGKQRLHDYYLSLGQFIDKFSDVEVAVTLTLRRYAGTSEAASKILFERVGLESAVKFISQLVRASAQSADIIADLASAFQQLDYIRIMRNYILHNGARQIAEGTGFVSNSVKAKSEETRYPVSPDLLDRMRYDLITITFRLNYNHLGRPYPQAATNIALLVDRLNVGWQYVHPTS
jgi:hypothetical protein